MERARKRLEEKDLTINSWYEDILSLEFYLQKFLKENNYNREESHKDIVFLNSESDEIRLKNARNKLETLRENKKQGLIQGVYQAKDHFDQFLEYYHIGFIKDFNLKKDWFHVKLSFLITSFSGIGDDDKTKELKMKTQLNILEGKGLKLHKSRGSYRIAACDSNKEILDVLFKSLHAKVWSYEIIDNDFRSVLLRIRPKDLLEANFPALSLDVTEEIKTEDRVRFLNKSLNQIYDSISYITEMPSLITTAGFVAEYCFSDICKSLKINTKLMDDIDNRYKTIRITNQEINQIEEEIGKLFTGEEIAKLGKEYFNEIHELTLREIGFSLSEDSAIGPYQVNLAFQYENLDTIASVLEFHELNKANQVKFEELELLADEIKAKLKNTFDVINPFDGEQYIAYTEKNINYINLWVEKTFHVQISKFEVDNKAGLLYIKSFTIVVEKIL